MTNFEDGDLTRIEGSMNYLIGNKSVTNIVDIFERYIFIVFWSILYDLPQPL